VSSFSEPNENFRGVTRLTGFNILNSYDSLVVSTLSLQMLLLVILGYCCGFIQQMTRCTVCGKSLDWSEKTLNGSVISLTAICASHTHKHRHVWSSSPQATKTRQWKVNVALVTAALCAGIGFESFRLFALMCGLPIVAQSTFWRLTDCVEGVTAGQWTVHQEELFLERAHERVEVELDGRYSNVQLATIGSSQVLDANTGHVLEIVGRGKSRTLNGRGIELEATKEAINTLILNLKSVGSTLGVVCVDGDASTTKFLNDRHPTVTVAKDVYAAVCSRKPLISQVAQREEVSNEDIQGMAVVLKDSVCVSCMCVCVCVCV